MNSGLVTLAYDRYGIRGIKTANGARPAGGPELAWFQLWGSLAAVSHLSYELRCRPHICQQQANVGHPSLLSCTFSAFSQTKPNILVIFGDDVGTYPRVGNAPTLGRPSAGQVASIAIVSKS